MPKLFSTEAKVGIFVILTVSAIAYLTIRMNRGTITLERAKHIYVVFSDASGVLTRTPVEFAGIRVGKVEGIELLNGKARVNMSLDPRVPLFGDTVVMLKNRGILGEKIVTIEGGGREAEVPDGGTMMAQGNSGDFDKAIQNFNEVAQGIRDLIKGGEGKPSLRDIVSNVTDISEDLRSLIRANRKNLDDIVKNAHDVTATLNNGDLKQIIENLKTTSDTIHSFVSSADPQLRDVVKDFKNVMGKVDGTVDSLNRIVGKIDRGEGTLGKLLSDETTVNKVNDTLDGINDFVGRVRKLEISVGFRGEYLSTARATLSTATFKLQPSYDKYFQFEFSNGPLEYARRSTTLTDTNTNGTVTNSREEKRKDSFSISAIFAKRFYDLTLKAGLMRGSAGFGAEYFLLKDRFSFGLDAFELARPENMHLRLYAAAHLWKVLHVNGGVDDLVVETKRRNYFGGLGILLTDNDLKALFGLAPMVAGGN